MTDLYQTFFTTFISTFFLNPFFAKTTRLVKTSFRDCARRCRDHCPTPFSHFVWQKGYFLCSQSSWVLCPPSFKSDTEDRRLYLDVNSQLSRFFTVRGSSTGFSLVGPARLRLISLCKIKRSVHI